MSNHDSTTEVISLLGTINIAIRFMECEMVRDILYKSAKEAIKDSCIVDKIGFLERLDEAYLPAPTGNFEVVAVAGHIKTFLGAPLHDFVIK